jgi:hypothetical protein
MFAGGLEWASDLCRDPVDARVGEAMNEGSGGSAVGGLVVLTGYAPERLGYLAALMSETLPRAFWALPPRQSNDERDLRSALRHLAAGTTVVQVAETDRQLAQFRDLASRVGARFLHVVSTPPAAPGDTPDPPTTPDAVPEGYGQRVFVHARASLTTQLEVVLTAWSKLGDTP